jgi:hypothetical protein
VWYRGSPAGTPRQDDLAQIRALGFSGVTWPARQTAGATELYRLAGVVGLLVTLRIEPVPLTPAAALAPGLSVDVPAATLDAGAMPALVWRAIAHGAQVVSFDPGQTAGTGLVDAAGHPRAWVESARGIARQLAVNGHLFGEWRPAGGVTIDAPAPAALDVALLEDARSWILVVTNTSRSRVQAVAHLPPAVPAALWADLLDGSMMSMLSQADGPRWSLTLDGGGARIYVINKIVRSVECTAQCFRPVFPTRSRPTPSAAPSRGFADRASRCWT